MQNRLRNIAIVAHVDHGKTTLVDQLLRQSGTLDRGEGDTERMLDSNALERERGITILSKNTAIDWRDWRINIVDTPGHADFGGEVERVLSMADAVLLLVDAVDGPMPQTRFVTAKAFARGLAPIVVINKIDRDGARPDWVLNETFELFDRLGANETQLDFTTVYASALHGYTGLKPDVRGGDMTPLLETLVERVPPPDVDPTGSFQMQVSSLDYDSYAGVIGTGRIARGRVRRGQAVTVVGRDGAARSARIGQVLGFMGLHRRQIERADAGDIVAITGIDDLGISETLCDPAVPEALPLLAVDEPTMHMSFEVNKAPFAGREGRFLTSRQIRERLERELKTNVALRVDPTDDPDRFAVAGRGLLHLGILIETMRREGYELAVSRPQAILREIDGEVREPWEELIAELDSEHQGAVIEMLAERGGKMREMTPGGVGRVRLIYHVPARGLIGFAGEFASATSGSGVLHHVFDHYGPRADAEVAQRRNGVLIANAAGKTLAYALFNLQARGQMLVGPGEPVYEGMIVGIHSRGNDLVVNPLKAKQLSNVRAAGKDDNVLLTPPVRLSLEQALEFINDDELVEVTPKAVRLRKRHLAENDRKRAARAG
jgi:GTP-binding protein